MRAALLVDRVPTEPLDRLKAAAVTPPPPATK